MSIQTTHTHTQLTTAAEKASDVRDDVEIHLLPSAILSVGRFMVTKRENVRKISSQPENDHTSLISAAIKYDRHTFIRQHLRLALCAEAVMVLHARDTKTPLSRNEIATYINQELGSNAQDYTPFIEATTFKDPLTHRLEINPASFTIPANSRPGTMDLMMENYYLMEAYEKVRTIAEGYKPDHAVLMQQHLAEMALLYSSK